MPENKNPHIQLSNGKWVRAPKSALEAYKQELFNVIYTTYAPIGGHPDFKTPDDITTNDADFWGYVNVDSDNEPDAVSAAKTTPAGIKYVMGATDGSHAAKKTYITSRIKNLRRKGFYVEVSHTIADILIKAGVPIVKSEEEVLTALRNKTIEWVGTLPGHLGDSWYVRKIGGTNCFKIMLGNPKVPHHPPTHQPKKESSVMSLTEYVNKEIVKQLKMKSGKPKHLTVYHGTLPKHVPNIKRDGLIDKLGYNQGWYMVSTDFESALYHAGTDDKNDFVYVFEFVIPYQDNDRWTGYPFLWKSAKISSGHDWFALMKPLPPEFIKKIHKVPYDKWVKQKEEKY